MKKFWRNPKFDQCCGMIFMLCAVWLKDTTLAVAAALSKKEDKDSVE
jgi:hypothetical protein